MKLAVILVFAVVLGVMGRSLYLLASASGNNKSLVRTLTIRVVLSVLLFSALYVAWYFGLIEPNTLPK